MAGVVSKFATGGDPAKANQKRKHCRLFSTKETKLGDGCMGLGKQHWPFFIHSNDIGDSRFARKLNASMSLNIRLAEKQRRWDDKVGLWKRKK